MSAHMMAVHIHGSALNRFLRCLYECEVKHSTVASPLPCSRGSHTKCSWWEPCHLHLLHGVPEEERGCDAALPAHGVKVPQLGSMRQEQSHIQSVNPEGTVMVS